MQETQTPPKKCVAMQGRSPPPIRPTYLKNMRQKQILNKEVGKTINSAQPLTHIRSEKKTWHRNNQAKNTYINATFEFSTQNQLLKQRRRRAVKRTCVVMVCQCLMNTSDGALGVGVSHHSKFVCAQRHELGIPARTSSRTKYLRMSMWRQNVLVHWIFAHSNAGKIHEKGGFGLNTSKISESFVKVDHFLALPQ